jgi:hypothetical protein
MAHQVAAPMTAAEEAKLRESVAVLEVGLGLQWTKEAMARVFATLSAEREAGRAVQVSDPLEDELATHLRTTASLDGRPAAIRAAISNAYYEARNDGATMEDAADRATASVESLLVGPATPDVAAHRQRAELVLQGVLELREMRGRLAKVTVDDIALLLAMIDRAVPA